MKSLIFLISFILLNCGVTVNVSASKKSNFMVLYNSSYNDFGSESIEDLALKSQANVVYRFYVYGESSDRVLYTVFVFPDKDIEEQYQNFYYSSVYEKSPVFEVNQLSDGDLIESHCEWDRLSFLSFVQMLGDSEVFSLPEIHLDYEPEDAHNSTGGNSFILFERYAWGRVTRIFRLGPPENSPAKMTSDWLMNHENKKKKKKWWQWKKRKET